MKGAAGVGWIVLLLLPALAVGARWILDAHREARLARPERGRSALEAEVPVWLADGELEPQASVVARVAALHGDPGRQAFETRVLGARDRGISGEPFLVVLELRGAGAARLDPGEAVVTDDAGIALSVPRLPPADGLDPVRTLLETPGPLRAGQRASFVMFGRAPGPGARIAFGPDREIALVPSREPFHATDLPIARVDRRAQAPAESTR